MLSYSILVTIPGISLKKKKTVYFGLKCGDLF